MVHYVLVQFAMSLVPTVVSVLVQMFAFVRAAGLVRVVRNVKSNPVVKMGFARTNLDNVFAIQIGLAVTVM